MDLQDRAKPDNASTGRKEVTDSLGANRRTSITNRIVDRNIWQTTHTSIHNTSIHNTSRLVDRNSQDIAFGDLLMEKKKDWLRIGFQNFNGLTGKVDDPVHQSLKD